VPQVPLNPEIVLAQAKRTLDEEPDADALREVRAALDEPAFFAELIEYLRGVNDPDVKARILSDLVEISRQCSDKSAERKNQLTNVRYGIGGGGALSIGGIIGMAASGAILLLPVVFAGIWIAGGVTLCYQRVKRRRANLPRHSEPNEKDLGEVRCFVSLATS